MLIISTVDEQHGGGTTHTVEKNRVVHAMYNVIEKPVRDGGAIPPYSTNVLYQELLIVSVEEG